jgi:hypothetical protein
MYEIVEGIHKALRIQSTWQFVLLMGVFGFIVVGGCAWIIDLGYRNSPEYKAEHPDPKAQTVAAPGNPPTVTPTQPTAPTQTETSTELSPKKEHLRTIPKQKPKTAEDQTKEVEQQLPIAAVNIGKGGKWISRCTVVNGFPAISNNGQMDSKGLLVNPSESAASSKCDDSVIKQLGEFLQEWPRNPDDLEKWNSKVVDYIRANCDAKSAKEFTDAVIVLDKRKAIVNCMNFLIQNMNPH